MRLECRGSFSHHRRQGIPLFSDPNMHHDTCVMHVPWCMSVLLTCGGGENVPGISGACATRNFTYLVRGPWTQWLLRCLYIFLSVLRLVNGGSSQKWLRYPFWLCLCHFICESCYLKFAFDYIANLLSCSHRSINDIFIFSNNWAIFHYLRF